eukprot:13780491-Ditylum_brightwellii.AAC.1
MVIAKPCADIYGDCYIFANHSKYKTAVIRKENEHGQETEGEDNSDEMDRENEEELPQEMADEERDAQ